MPHSFDSHAFGELAADTDRLAARAAEHERQLAAVVDAVERDPSPALLGTLRELCAGAREQRLIADTMRARLLGDIALAGDETVHRPLVLIVDDSQDNRDMAAMLLETSGFDAITAGNGLEGVIVAMTPQNPPNAATVARVNLALQRAIGECAHVRPQLSLVLRRSVPEPDLAVVPGSPDDYEASHPRMALLVVEVALPVLLVVAEVHVAAAGARQPDRHRQPEHRRKPRLRQHHPTLRG